MKDRMGSYVNRSDGPCEAVGPNASPLAVAGAARNARRHLEAAADQMLAALKAVERHNDNPARYDSYINEIVCAAIAKAEGA